MTSNTEEVPDPKTFKCQEFDEYLLIEDSGTPCRGGTAGPCSEQISEPHCQERIRREGSLDSGYDGKHSRTSSPKEGKQPAEPAEREVWKLVVWNMELH